MNIVKPKPKVVPLDQLHIDAADIWRLVQDHVKKNYSRDLGDLIHSQVVVRLGDEVDDIKLVYTLKPESE